LWIGLVFLIAMTISTPMSRAHPVAPIIAGVYFEVSLRAANITMGGIRAGSIMTLHQSVLPLVFIGRGVLNRHLGRKETMEQSRIRCFISL
jgi:hypothetical protein